MFLVRSYPRQPSEEIASNLLFELLSNSSRPGSPSHEQDGRRKPAVYGKPTGALSILALKLEQSPDEKKITEVALKHWHVGKKMSQLQKLLLDAPFAMKGLNENALEELVDKAGKLIRRAEKLLDD